MPLTLVNRVSKGITKMTVHPSIILSMPSRIKDHGTKLKRTMIETISIGAEAPMKKKDSKINSLVKEIGEFELARNE